MEGFENVYEVLGVISAKELNSEKRSCVGQKDFLWKSSVELESIGLAYKEPYDY